MASVPDMRGATFVAALAWVAGLGVSGAQPAATAAVDLYVENIAAVPRSILENAQAECGHIFERAGVVVRWTVRARSTTPPATALTLIIVASEPQLPAMTVEPLGMAPAGDVRHRGRIAYVFYDRLRPFMRPQASGRDRFFDTGEILGAVMAHEVGHLLLPLHAAHGATGIMRGIWNADQFQRAAFGLLEFTRDEAERIHDELRSRAESKAERGSP